MTAPASPEAAARPLVEIIGVEKVYPGGAKALSEIDIKIADNEFFTLLGPSGCGKTTLLRLIGGFEQPTAGQIRIQGRDVAGLPPQKRPVNTVFQSYALFPHLTVAENVAFGLEMLGWRQPDIPPVVADMLTLVRLDAFAKRKPAQLSGGQQQRVALARALAPHPKLLLLDEPLSALDLKLRKGMQIELKRLQRETGITFILVTHDQEEALAMSDRIAVMNTGRVLQIGTPTEIYDSPATPHVADFIGEANLIPGALIGRAADTIIAVRPERVTVRAGMTGGRVVGTVSEIAFLGADTLVEAHVADGLTLRARLRGTPPDGVMTGDRVSFDWPAEAERAFPAD